MYIVRPSRPCRADAAVFAGGLRWLYLLFTLRLAWMLLMDAC